MIKPPDDVIGQLDAVQRAKRTRVEGAPTRRSGRP